MAIPNQGFRKDLNLKETEVSEDSINALGGAGISQDIILLQNNLRNTSRIGFNSVDALQFFSFAEDLTIPVSKIDITNTNIIINLTNPYDVKVGDIVDLDGMTGGAASLNGFYPVKIVSTDLKEVTLAKSSNYTEQDVTLTSVSFTIKPQNIFTFTNGDEITLSSDVTFTDGTTPVTLSQSKTYYVVNSNAVNKFKLSETLDGSAITIPANATATPNNFSFIRSDAVYQEDLINFIEPEYQDQSGEDFDSFSFLEDHGTINAAFDDTRVNIDEAEYFMSKKYRGDKDMTTSDMIKFEGSLALNDPTDNITASGTDLTTNPKAPGVYIGNTRAFSSDNNPWKALGTKGQSDARLETSSDEVKIGELAFLDGTDSGSMVIEGIADDVENVSLTNGAVSSLSGGNFTHKLPVTVQDELGNQETYFLLLSDS
tara:strand:- start:49 stop:1332 length:1284 start_codon:yes stop_codon:yes gene_type:complete